MKLVIAIVMVAGCSREYGGDPTPPPPTPTPIPVVVDAGLPDSPPAPWIPTRNTISAGLGSACVRDAGAQLVCWGRGSDTPKVVPGVTGVTAVVTGQTVACALTASGAVYCLDGGAPVKIAGLDDAVELATDPDAFLTCARRKTGRVACWSSLGKPSPIANVGGIEGALEIAVGGSTACIRDKDGVACWSAGWVDATPVATVRRIPQARTATRLAGGRHKFAALIPGKPPVGWLEDHDTPYPLPPLPADTTQIAIGGDDACAMYSAGVSCWRAMDPKTIHTIPAVAGANEIAVGHALGCARMGSELHCWGSIGGLGDGTPVTTDTPVVVANLTDAARIAVGGESTCARRTGGQVVCWGAGQGGRNDPAPVPATAMISDSKCSTGCGPGVKREWSGRYQRGAWTCTRRAKVTCEITFYGRRGEVDTGPEESWGNLDDVRDIRMPSNMFGSVCVAGATGKVNCFSSMGGGDPETITGIDDAVELAMYRDETCALEKAGTVKCWNDEAGGVKTIPGITNAVEIAGGDVHACARLATGQVRCWGYRTLLGDNVDRFQRTPKLVAGIAL